MTSKTGKNRSYKTKNRQTKLKENKNQPNKTKHNCGDFWGNHRINFQSWKKNFGFAFPHLIILIGMAKKEN